ncbi:Lsr2 family protein [Nonomuraea gerenzanensis]|uniref:Lsr2 DNA-binding domain-containing protein n=1 Tax=Nonomuraea gerenzanensis TaxID=93944 RepID=A0A1M4EQD6_9ACTN|nr:Lsr2 family protein [Nonomuraea gerenzanensis]UBU12472.1 Lsr2 family protein [Nonomuraea gerenzanensis]SBP01025.1 hypothetical protein BN4615_P10541 [Nonomuraea gerenzanensis]
MSTSARAVVYVSYHRLIVQEQGDAIEPSHVPNRLTASAPGAAVILTGLHTGVVDVTVRLTDTPPTGPGGEGWDEVEEVELVSFTGEMRLTGFGMNLPEELPVLTAHGPGRYGMRVHARGRGVAESGVPGVPAEFYLVTVWPVDVGPQAYARLGIGVAEELGLPDKSREIREWARQHGLPQSERGRIAGLDPRSPARPAVPAPLRAVAVADEHRLRVVNPFQDTAPAPDLPAGLVAAAPDSLVIHTLNRRGTVDVHLNWRPSALQAEARGWEESEEIEFVTTTGIMQVASLSPDDGQRPNLTCQGAGRYGLRVHGRSRGRHLSNRPRESYLLVVWPIELGAPAAGALR